MTEEKNVEKGREELSSEVAAKLAELESLNAQIESENRFAGVRTTRELFKLFMIDRGYTVGVDSFMEGMNYEETGVVAAEFQEWYQLLPPVVHKEIKHLLSETKINGAITKILADSYKDYMREKYEFLSQPPKEPGAQWRKLDEMSGLSEECQIIYEAVVWKAKRQMRTRQPVRDMQQPMPILYTPQQEMGKTYFNRMFRGVIGELSDSSDFMQIEDDKFVGNWAKTIVGDFDEMKGLTYKNIEAAKSFLTEITLSGRTMYRPTKTKVAKMTIAIGSSNRCVAQLVPDTTGSRRFWEERLIEPLIETAKTIDFVELWREVDDTKPCRYHNDEVRERIRNIQLNEQKRPALIEIFFEKLAKDKDGVAFADEDLLDRATPVKPGDSWGSQELYNMYRDLGEEMGIKPLIMKSFRKELKARYGNCFKFKETNKNNRWFAIKSDRWEVEQNVDEVETLPDAPKGLDADEWGDSFKNPIVDAATDDIDALLATIM